MDQLSKFEKGLLKTSRDIASPSRELYRSVFLGEWGDDEKVYIKKNSQKHGRNSELVCYKIDLLF